MTLGERIEKLRTENGISKEELARRLETEISEISEWESDKSEPHTDRIMALCELFSVTAAELLKEPNKYFGTDGFRGEANVRVTADHAYKVGRFLGRLKRVKKLRVVIGKDTRRSSYMLEYSLAAGLAASGADVYILHVITTPGVAFVTRNDGFDFGIMITASHNPYFDNGIKILDSRGEKIGENLTELIEKYLDSDTPIPFAEQENIGRIVDYSAGRNRYVGYLISLAFNSYKNLKIGIDCANGAAWNLARTVFSSLGAEVFALGDSPDGLNVNRGCGSTSPEKLCRLVSEKGLDVGFAFDGDADRCIAVDEKGKILDGDVILYILAKRLLRKGALSQNKVVATVMSNSGLFRALEKLGVTCEITDVGDRFVYEKMEKDGIMLGGESSGHIILRKYATTGDGLLTALMLAEELSERKEKMSALASGITLLPKKTENLFVTDRNAVLRDRDILKKVENAPCRLLFRASGTEPVIRITAESEDIADCEKCISEITDFIRKKGY